jgi:ParB family chromosome partitioning protein
MLFTARRRTTATLSCGHPVGDSTWFLFRFYRGKVKNNGFGCFRDFWSFFATLLGMDGRANAISFAFRDRDFTRNFCGMAAKPVLGRGLGALLSGAAPASKAGESAARPASLESERGERVQRVAVARIRPCAFQPRKDFPPGSLQELADSIKEQGIVQPLIVRPLGANYELIAGERRWRAAQMIGLGEVPVIVRQADDRAVLELALIENLQRENLNAIEEAQGYDQLIKQFQLTQEEAAVKVGKSRVVVANALRLLKLAPELQAYVRDGLLSVGHAKVILGLTAADDQKQAAERILQKSLNVRQTEELVSFLQGKGGEKPVKKNAAGLVSEDAHVANLRDRLQERFGTRVIVRYQKGQGAIEIKFFNDADLDRILQVAGLPPDSL